MRFYLWLPFLLLPAMVQADRQLTPEERAAVTAALESEGCMAEEMEFDNGLFEVDDADCDDGNRYDFELDADFNIVKKDRHVGFLRRVLGQEAEGQDPTAEQ